MVSDTFPINSGQSWSQKVLAADNIWRQVKQALEAAGQELPKTPRRPDVRMILNNNTGEMVQFLNPGDHSGQKQEFIPGDGDKGTAAMLMLGGDTLEKQQANAAALDAKYNLSENGLTPEFAAALSQEAEAGLVREAYGPAPFEGQASRLVSLAWGDASIEPHQDGHVAYGARAPEMETVMRSEMAVFVHGTGTTPEKMEMEGICIAVSSDWQTGKISTRPIVPSVAQEYYGEHYSGIPVVELDVEGNVASIDLKNGTPVIYLDDPRGSSERYDYSAEEIRDIGQP